MSAISNQPNFSSEQVADQFLELYELELSAVRDLPGERDQNFHVVAVDGREFVFKVCNPDEPSEFLKAQSDVTERLGQFDFIASPLHSKSGSQIERIAADGSQYWVRTVSFVPGRPLAELKRPSDRLLSDLGEKLAHVDLALLDYQSAILEREFDWNLLHGLSVVQHHARLISDLELKELVTRLSNRIARTLEMHGATLRQHHKPPIPNKHGLNKRQ